MKGMEARRRSRKATSPLGSSSRSGSRSTKREQDLFRLNRKRKAQSGYDAESQGRSKTFAILKPRLRHVPQGVVRSRWDVVPQSVHDRIRELLKLIEKPVIMSQGNGRTGITAQVAVTSVLRTLERRISKVPFPPGTKDLHFNLETILASNHALDSQLTPATHAVGLLKAEVAREEASLAAEVKILQDLKVNARAEEILRRRQAKNVHESVKASPELEPDNHHADNVGLVRSMQPAAPSLIAGLNTSIKPLLAELLDHLDSIEVNTVQAIGIGHRMSVTQALVDDAVYRRGDVLVNEQSVA